MGKKNKRYQARRKDSRRNAKRKNRKQQAGTISRNKEANCKHIVTVEGDSNTCTGQLDTNGCNSDSAVDEKKRYADRKALEAMKLDCQRLRKMLYFEQCLPSTFK